MKNIKYIIVLFVTVILSSCYEEEHFLDNNSTSNGNYFAVIQSVSVDNVPEIGGFAVGETAKIVVDYWSLDPVKELELFDVVEDTLENKVETMILTTPSNYVVNSKPAKVSLDYIVPVVPPNFNKGRRLVLKVFVINENGLVSEKSTEIKVLK